MCSLFAIHVHVFAFNYDTICWHALEILDHHYFHLHRVTKQRSRLFENWQNTHENMVYIIRIWRGLQWRRKIIQQGMALSHVQTPDACTYNVDTCTATCTVYMYMCKSLRAQYWITSFINVYQIHNISGRNCRGSVHSWKSQSSC